MAFILPVSVAAKNTRLIFISNEKSSTITVLDGRKQLGTFPNS